MASAWRQLDFFTSESVQDANHAATPGPAMFTTTSNGSVVIAGCGVVLIGDQEGTLQALNKQFIAIATVKAYTEGQVDHVLPCADNLIATVGQERSGQRALKIWELRKSKSGVCSFKHLSTVVINTDQPYPITCCTAQDDLSHIAIGFSNGRVMLIKGDLARDRGAKQRTIYEGEEPITALEFLTSSLSTTLYIFSTSKLLTLTISNAAGRSVIQVPRVMESVGAALHCVSKQKSKNELVVVREDAIYLYGVQGRGPCYALASEKSVLSLHESYVVVIQAPNVAKSGTLKILGKMGIPDPVDDAARITIMETNHKFIAHTGYFPQGVRHIFSAWGSLHLVTTDGKLFRLDEISMTDKLDILFSRGMYTLALSLAQEASIGIESINNIRIRYGDYLYGQGEFELSVKQYISAIRHCDASAIMRKFLEAQHVPLLAEFLEALHLVGLSNADYTTLLLNCYAKLKNEEKLSQFIKDETAHPIDLDIAVALCRQAGYFDQAVSLSAKHNNHAICLGIMIEDKQDHLAALNYIKKLKDAGDVGSMLNQFGRELMVKLTDETTRLMIDFYTGNFTSRSSIEASGIMSPPRRVTTSYGAAFYDSMVNNRYAQVLPSLPSLDMSQFYPMKRVSSISASVKSNPIEAVAGESTLGDSDGLKYAVPAARTAFPIFADYPAQFIRFLEAILERQSTNADDTDRIEAVSTLLETYLRLAKQASPERSAELFVKTRALLKNESAFIDSSNAMLLFHISSFQEGFFTMQEKTGRKEDVFRSYCTAKDTEAVINMLQQHGEDEPQLFILALKYLISSPKIVLEAGAELGRVLNKIQEKRLLSPLQVIQAMSVNTVANVGIVKEYLSSIIEKERKEISTNESLIESYRNEAILKTKEATDLAHNTMTLQVSRCARCGGTLELPVVHFLCKHSFHSRCITTSTDNMVCPVCEEANNAVRAIVKSKAELAEKQDFFRENLANSRDKANFLFSRMDLTTEQALS